MMSASISADVMELHEDGQSSPDAEEQVSQITAKVILINFL